MEKLDSKSLMLGDWVRNDLGEIQRIEEIRQEDVMLSYNDYYSYDEIEPITITPEILEKNGFIRDGESWWYKDFRIVLFSSNGVSLICGRQMRFKYVHELQHAIRLCGIEKQIII